jgi:hypothetical protein
MGLDSIVYELSGPVIGRFVVLQLISDQNGRTLSPKRYISEHGFGEGSYLPSRYIVNDSKFG